ncbi:hypothetical protein [Streptomyces lincolnensis]|uniref:hypothetical protein n=1 Tax=Streptomyces lincolnensis TaxID=1915 RepID=UPI0008295EDD|nr:hypothetical protein [Streptomyces lincolnensis]QMV04300.1 hypothetical protein GJU35_00370 [Streptomyces lincolnensis]QMV12023.1 hypothetical protein GJU35_44550 [Streptomyces lincolnensis]
MTHYDSDAELDALLRSADDAVLAAVEDSLDLDAGRAVLFAQVTVREHGDRQPPGWKIGPDGSVTDFAGIPVEAALQREIYPNGSVRRSTRVNDVNGRVTNILDLLDQISYDLDLLRRWLDCLSEGRPLGPGHVENAATLLAALVVGVRERNMSEQTAIGLVEQAKTVLRTLWTEVRPHLEGEEDQRSAADRLLNLELALVATKSLVVELFADDGDQSSLRPVPTR